MQRINSAKYLAALCLLVLWQPAMAQTADTSKNLTVVPIAAAKSFDKQALVIGIASYELARPLTVPPDDARAFAKLLETRFGFPRDAVVLMTDDPATPERLRPTQAHVRTAINNLIANMTDTSEVVVFFSGHGTIDGNEDWLVPIDGDPSDIQESCISYDSLKKRIDIKQPHRALLVVDACRNLQRGKDTTPSGFGSGYQVDVGPQIAELLSCHPTEVSQEGLPEDFHESVFTHFLLKGLSGAPEAMASGTSQVTFDSLRSYVQGSVKQYVSAKFGAKQTPDGRASLGTMVLALGDNGVVSQPDIVVNTVDTVARLHITTDPPGAKVLVDGTALLGPDYSVDLGVEKTKTVEVGVEMDGYKAKVQQVTVTRGVSAPLTVTLDSAKDLNTGAAEAKAKYDRADGLFNEKKYAEAEVLDREAVRLEPTNARYQNAVSADLQRLNRWGDAEPFSREATRLEPTNAKYQDALGSALEGQGKYVDAEPFYRESVRLEPANAAYQYNLGNTVFGEMKFADAEPYLREAVRLEPTNAQYQHELGNVLYNQQKYVEAEPFYREAVRLASTNNQYKTDLDDCLKQIH